MVGSRAVSAVPFLLRNLLSDSGSIDVVLADLVIDWSAYDASAIQLLEYPQNPPSRRALQGVGLHRFAGLEDMLRIALAVVGFFKLAGLLDEATLPWPRVVMAVGQFRRFWQVSRGDAGRPCRRHQAAAKASDIGLYRDRRASGSWRAEQHRCYCPPGHW